MCAIKRFLSQNKQVSIKQSFLLFDVMVKPIILYGSEIWGYQRRKCVESVQIQFCKLLLKLGSHTSNDASLGECGRYNLYVDSLFKCIKFWIKVIHMPNDRLPKDAYDMLYGLDQYGKNTWASEIKYVLNRTGFSYVWISQTIGNVKLFLSELKQRIIDIEKQKWYSSVTDNKYCMYIVYSKQN